MAQWKPPLGARVDRSSSGSKGLVAYWPFNEGGGIKVNDVACYSKQFTGTMTSMANPSTASSGWGGGKFGQIINFDGTNDYIDCGSSTYLKAIQNTSFSVTAWIKPALDSTNRAIIGNAEAAPGYHFRVNTANAIRFIILHSGGVYKFSDTAALSAGWSFVACTWSGLGTQNIATYVNGRLSSSVSSAGSLPGSITSANNTYIGNVPSDTKWWKGGLDGVRLYDRVLSAQEVMELYRNPFVGIVVPKRRNRFKKPASLSLARSYGYSF